MPSRILAIPFFIIIFICVFLMMKTGLSSYMSYALPPFFVLAIIYILQPQVDWWYYKKHPPAMDEPIKKLFIKYSSFYNGLSLENKKRFRDRVCLYSMAKEFIPKGMEEIPEDLKAIIASSAVQLSFGREDFLLSKFEQIIVYLQVFPSPQFPEELHASEIFEEDGAILFSAEHLTAIFKSPQQYYNIALHEYAKVFILSYPFLAYPVLEKDHWKDLEAISGFSQKYISDFIGLTTDDLLAVSITCFFSFPHQYKSKLPNIFDQYKNIFKLDPSMETQAILKY